MGKVITFNKRKLIYEKEKRGDNMYEALVAKLKKQPATLYNVNAAEDLARQVLEIGGYNELTGPTPIIEIAKEFGFVTYKTSDMPEDISGNIFVGGTTKDIYDNNKVIIVSNNEELFHQRFIVAHELAHYLLDCVGNPEYIDESILFSKTYPKTNHDSVEETRADRFAAELLMPTKEFTIQYIKAMKRSNKNMRYVITYLSDFFETKKSSIRQRIQEVIN